MSNKDIYDTINKLKDENQDFEWYPTDDRIIDYLVKSLPSKYKNNGFSLLDIGCGNGSFFKIFENKLNNSSIIKYAIEKSSILTSQLQSDIFIIGTDFYQQTLIDKIIDIIFCNPPYSEYVEWMVKIIKEACCDVIYMVVPKRWKDNNSILEVIRLRSAVVKHIGSFNFVESIYRQARTEVDVLEIIVSKKSDYWSDKSQLKIDPFEVWFKEHFAIKIDKSCCDNEFEKKKEIHKQCDIIKGQNLIEGLTELYNNDMKHLMDNYKKLSELDSNLLKELDVDINNLQESLNLKIKGLKNIYWNELFDRLEVLTRRLTCKSRKELLGILMKNTSVDFLVDNIYAIILWAIKNSNLYIDKQLIEVYKELSRKENIENYRSNHVMYDDEWRYREDLNQGRVKKYRLLDYRLVIDRYMSIEQFYPKGNMLTESTINFLNDLMVIAENLGFDCCKQLPDKYSSENTGWEYGKEYEFFYRDGLLMTCRFYKNGNIHIKPNKDFIRRLNVEAARLNGWIKSPRDYTDETDEFFESVSKDYKSNFVIHKNGLQLLC